MEVVGVVFIAPNHFLAVASFLPTADGPRPWSGRSASAHQQLKSQWSAVTTISTTVGTPKQGYPFLQHEDAVPTWLSLVAW
jgi:hypothetical protein